jgi:2-polyprenyl-3-methyl-5-hydroxy-6-metoxy-1,4-benzoquinol methylase
VSSSTAEVVTRPEAVSNQLAFYGSSNPTRRWLHNARMAWITSAIERAAATLCVAHELAVEVGPGAGMELPTLAGTFSNVVAVDVEPAFVERSMVIAKDHPNIKALVADATRPVAGLAPADLVLCTEVLEHVEEPGKLIAGLYGLLKPGGVLILTTPQRHSFLEMTAKMMLKPGFIQIVRKLYGEVVVELHHISLRTSSEVHDMATAAGFEVVEHVRMGCYLPVLAEFGGERAQQLEARLQPHISEGPLSGLLWTQCWILRRP